MKTVVDTNVLISGVFFSGPPFQVLNAWRDRRLEIVVSPEILEEYARVGSRLAGQFESVTFEPFLALLVTCATIVDPTEPPPSVVSDPDDNKFFACAIAAECKLIISGDRHLLEASGECGVRVLTPSKFVEEFL